MRCISGFCDIATLNWDKCCWQRLAKPWTGENELCRSCTIFNFKFSLPHFQLANWTQLSSWKFDAASMISIFSTYFTPNKSFKASMNSEKSWKRFSSWNRSRNSIWSHVNGQISKLCSVGIILIQNAKVVNIYLPFREIRVLKIVLVGI